MDARLDKKAGRLFRWGEWVTYLFLTGLTLAVVVYMMRLWRATWSVPFFYTGDAVYYGAHTKTTMEWGWYEFQPDLSAPYGQRFNDFLFSDNLHYVIIRGLRSFTGSWPIAFNAYYVAAFVFCAWGALWFLRREGINRPVAVVLAILFAVAPYHFIRNENHYVLAAYWTVPLLLVVTMDAMRGLPLWSRNLRAGRYFGLTTGRGAIVALLLLIAGSTTAYYAVFGTVLLTIAGLGAFARTRHWRRFFGVVSAAGVLTVIMFANLLPDFLYAQTHGLNAGAVVRDKGGSETYGLKLTSLLLPAPGHPIKAWAAFRNEYDLSRPLASEQPALGTICALALVAVLIVACGRIGSGGDRGSVLRDMPRHQAVGYLAFLTIIAFLFATVGGIGAFVSFATGSIRGLNRISIFMSLLLLGIVGLYVQSVGGKLSGRVARTRVLGSWARTRSTQIVMAVFASILLAAGVLDQQTAGSVPPYEASAEMWNSDEAFVQRLMHTVPVGSMIFQVPFMAYPEAGPAYDASDQDLIKLSLHTTVLRWSLGGVKGRSQADWPKSILRRPPDQVTDVITRMGFTGIVVDRWATNDRGATLEASYASICGPPAFTSPDGRWAFLSLQRQLDRANASMTPQQRQDLTAQVLNGAG